MISNQIQIHEFHDISSFISAEQNIFPFVMHKTKTHKFHKKTTYHPRNQMQERNALRCSWLKIKNQAVHFLYQAVHLTVFRIQFWLEKQTHDFPLKYISWSTYTPGYPLNVVNDCSTYKNSKQTSITWRLCYYWRP